MSGVMPVFVAENLFHAVLSYLRVFYCECWQLTVDTNINSKYALILLVFKYSDSALLKN